MLAETLVLTDFGVCLLVEHVRVILFERQRSYCGAMLEYYTRLKCWERFWRDNCCPTACLLLYFLACIQRCMLEWFMGLGMVFQRRVGMWSHWMGCLPCLRSIMYFNWLACHKSKRTKNRHFVHKNCPLIYRFVAQVASSPNGIIVRFPTPRSPK